MSEMEIGRLSALLESMVTQADRRDRIIEGLVSEQNSILQDLTRTIAHYEHTVKHVEEIRSEQASQKDRSDKHESRISNIEVAKQAVMYLAGILAPIIITGLGTAVWFYWKSSL